MQQRRPAAEGEPKGLLLVSVVIVNHNGRKYLPGLLNSLESQTYQNFETTLVDNCSDDDSLGYVERNFPWVILKPNSTNSGYAKGLNDGIRHARGDYILLLNNDVELTRDVIAELVRVLNQYPEVAVVQPKVLSQSTSGYFDYAGAAGGEIDVLFYPFCRGRIFESIEEDRHQYDNSRYIFWAGGAVFIVRKEIFSKIGLFDEDFFLYHEETDFCWRVNLSGFRVAYDGAVSAYHHGSKTFGRFPSGLRYFYMHRNSLYLIFKYEKGGRLVLTFSTRCLFEFINIFYSIKNGRWTEAAAIIQGTFSAIIRSPTMLIKRKAIRNMSAKNATRLDVYPRFIVLDYFLGGKRTYNSLYRSS